jgi:hypothetical protein
LVRSTPEFGPIQPSDNGNIAMQPQHTSYPVFEANQVLTNAHLNQLFDYLDDQQRLTRANLTGIGIVCGLDIELDNPAAPAKIFLSKGCGITSEGYLLAEPQEKLELVAYRQLDIEEDLHYLPFKDNDTQFALWELLTAESLGDANVNQLAEAPTSFLDDKALVLVLELKQASLRNCSPNNCDDKGSEVEVKVRRLLVELNKLTAYAPLQLPEIPLARVHFAAPADLQNYQQVYKDFFAKQTDAKTAVSRLLDAIDQSYGHLKLLIPDLDNAALAQLSQQFDFPADKPTIQYYYDWLRDLTAAYHELRTALMQTVPECLPDASLFPRHLVLGVLKNSGNQQYRSRFLPSPALVLAENRRGELRFLFERLLRMVQDFNILPDEYNATPPKIIPSQFGYRHLSGKALPFYYRPELRPYWDASRKDWQARNILSWHEDADSPAHVRQPLDYDLEAYNFLRIEGHVGKNLLAVTTTLGELIKNRRLPISILYLSTDAVGDFLERHPGLEHQAGTLRDGTFVVLYGGSGINANIVLADFALPYRIERAEASADLCKVTVKECAYPWFDSRRHLGNLARRDYSGSKEGDRDLLADNYVIVVYRYEIQGQPLIPKQISVPIQELINGQLSAIAHRLNQAFPNGVVFDYDRASDKLIIRYFADQTFRIEWGGLQGNQIRYAYTPDGVYRWQKGAWEPLSHLLQYKVTCRLRDEYHADEYQWLQENAHYQAKYPAPSAMPTEQDLVNWEGMIKLRASKPLPASVQNLLGSIGKAIDEAYNVGGLTVEAVLIGPWANGSWVSRTASENNFPAGFSALREKITGKKITQHSDIDLLIHTEDKSINREDIMAILSDYSVSGYAINVIFGKKDAQKWK